MRFLELEHWLRLLKRVVLIFGLLLCFGAIVEFLRAYVTLREVHPVLGYSFLAGVMVAIAAATWWVVQGLARLPRVLSPPTPVDRERPSPKYSKRYARYLTRYLDRLAKNELLSLEDRSCASKAASSLSLVIQKTPSAEEMKAVIAKAEAGTIDPLLDKLDDRADARRRRAVCDISLGVALSPYRSIDLLIVLYRNAVMTVDIASVYNSRPQARELFVILKDTLAVVAAVNFLNLGSRIIESVGKGIPIVGRGVDEISQAVGAGLFSSVVGRTAQRRCKAFRGWDRAEAVENMASKLGGYVKDVRDLVVKDVVGAIGGRLAWAAEKISERTKDLTHALGETADSIARRTNEFVRVPVASVAVAGTGAAKGLRGMQHGLRRVAGTAGSGARTGAASVLRGGKKALSWLRQSGFGFAQRARQRFRRSPSAPSDNNDAEGD